MTPAQRRAIAEIKLDCNESEAMAEPWKYVEKRWRYRGEMSAAMSGHVGSADTSVSFYESRERPGTWFAWQCSPAVPWAAGPASFDDVRDDVVEYLLAETILADGPRRALARAEQVERRQRRAS